MVDWIEDGLATAVIEEDGTDAYELVVEPMELPDDGQHADAVLSVEIRDNELIETTYEASETSEQQESAQRRFDRLSERPPSDDNE